VRRAAWSIGVSLALFGVASFALASGPADHSAHSIDSQILEHSVFLADDLDGMIAFEVGGRIATMRGDGSAPHTDASRG